MALSKTRSPRVSLWSGLPGPNEKVVGTGLVSRIVPRRDAADDAAGDGVLRLATAVEVIAVTFVQDCLREDYEASDLLYGSEAYAAYAAEHFCTTDMPTSLAHLHDLQQMTTLPVRFLWFAAFVTTVQ